MMRGRVFLCIVAAVFAVAVSCVRGNGGKPWAHAGKEVDILTARLDSLSRTEASEREFGEAVGALSAAASRNGTTDRAKARAAYWQAYMIERYTRADSTGHEEFLPLLDRARSLLDSSSSPYDMARVASLEANALDPDRAVKAYLGCYDVFSRTGDADAAAAAMFNLAYIFQHYGDYASADICYGKSIDMMERQEPLDSGKYLRAWNHRMVMHRNMGDTAGAVKLAEKVASMPFYEVSDKVVLGTEKMLYYDGRHDIRHLRKAMERAVRLGWEEDVTPLFLSHFLAEGPADSVACWKIRTLQTMPASGELDNRISRAMALRDCYAAEGNDSAALYADTLAMLTAELRRLRTVADGNSGIRRALLDGYVQRESDRERRGTVTAICVAAGIVLLLAGAVWLTWRYRRKGKMALEERNEGFEERLLRKHPDLTPGELRLACMVRSGADNKHIARLLGISPGSVYTNRSRLRQKLLLDPDTNLDIYLRSF